MTAIISAIKIIIFVITSLPALIKALKELYRLVSGDKKLAKNCITEICSAEHLKSHVDKQGFAEK